MSLATVDVGTLLAQIIIVLSVTAILYVALSGERRALPIAAPSIEDSQRVLDSILECDVVKLHAALTQLISAEIARRSRVWTPAK